MRRKTKRVLLALFVLITVAIAVMIVCSPYGQMKNVPYKAVQHTVTIKAPVQTVFRYLGNSAHAAQWSVFVDHIVPLNAGEVPDGLPGSRRRCFKYRNEQGLQWDELITVVEPGKRRQLTLYNMKHFLIQAGGLATEQLYEAPAPAETRLTFTLFFKTNDQSLPDKAKMYFAAYQVKRIFRSNMDNIKKAVEAAH